MPTDLTERLAAKLKAAQQGCICGECAAAVREVSRFAPTILPLLLSEPELVAGLPEAVRLSVLTPRERAVLKLGEKYEAFDDAVIEWDRGESKMNRTKFDAARDEMTAALAEARALAPSPAPLEGTNDE